MPERPDSVREHVIRAARELGLEPKIAFEVRSIAAIKHLVIRGAAAAILPYGSVLEDVTSGRLEARQIVSPGIRRTMFLASSNKGSRFKNEVALAGVIRASLGRLTEVLGSMAHPLPPHDSGR